MANFLRKTVRLEYSSNSDYSSPIKDVTLTQEETTPTWMVSYERLTADTSGITIELDNQPADADECIVVNHDTTNFLTFTWRNTVNGTTESIYVEPGAIRDVGEVLSVGDLLVTADTADVEFSVYLLGPAS